MDLENNVISKYLFWFQHPLLYNLVYILDISARSLVCRVAATVFEALLAKIVVGALESMETFGDLGPRPVKVQWAIEDDWSAFAH